MFSAECCWTLLYRHRCITTLSFFKHLTAFITSAVHTLCACKEDSAFASNYVSMT